MVELTLGNHFKFGYSDQFLNWRTSKSDQFHVEYGKCLRDPMDFGSECVVTAEFLGKTAPRKIQLLFSGGGDSEAMVRAFLRACVPFEIVVIRFSEGLNAQDVNFADKFCQLHDLKSHYLDLDVIRFFESGRAMEYAERTQSVSPQFLHHMWAMDQLDGFPILGSGECYLRKQNVDDPVSIWAMHEKEKVVTWYKYFLWRDRPGCPGFYQYTPELMLSWLREPLIVNLVNNRIPGKLSSISSKLAIYKRYFPMTETPLYGQTGFERLMKIDDVIRPILRDKFGDEECRIPYQTLVDRLSPEPL